MRGAITSPAAVLAHPCSRLEPAPTALAARRRWGRGQCQGAVVQFVAMHYYAITALSTTTFPRCATVAVT